MLSDEELLAKIAARNGQAFETLAARYRDTLRRYLIGMARQPDVADDLLQETLLRVWTRAEQWDGRGTVKSWLFRVATNLALNDLRNRKRRREQSLESGDADSADDAPPAWMLDTATPTPEQCALQSEESHRLRRLVAGLPEARRAMLRLVYEEDMELRDVADLLDIPEGTVKSRLYHARKHLSRCWNAEQGEEE